MGKNLGETPTSYPTLVPDATMRANFGDLHLLLFQDFEVSSHRFHRILLVQAILGSSSQG